jgi:hypothetical protein
LFSVNNIGQEDCCGIFCFPAKKNILFHRDFFMGIMNLKIVLFFITKTKLVALYQQMGRIAFFASRIDLWRNYLVTKKQITSLYQYTINPKIFE